MAVHQKSTNIFYKYEQKGHARLYDGEHHTFAAQKNVLCLIDSMFFRSALIID